MRGNERTLTVPATTNSDIPAFDLHFQPLDYVADARQVRMHVDRAAQRVERALVVADDAGDIDATVAQACRIAYREGFAKPNQRVIIVAGVPLGTPGATNMVRIAYVGSGDVGE